MKHSIYTIMASMIAAVAAVAAPQYHEFTPIALGTNTSGTSTLTLRGYVDTIYVSSSDAVSTGTVSVSYVPAVGTTTVNVATNVVVDEDVWRPVVDRTDTAGTALTSDDPAPYALVGETLTFSVSSSPTGLTWKCLMVIDDGK